MAFYVIGRYGWSMTTSWNTKDDAELLSLIRGGSHHAFSVLTERHAVRFYRLAYRYMGQRQEAEDMVQEALLKLWERPDMWKPEKNVKFTTWFYRVVVNLCLDRKKQKTPLPLSETLVIEDNRPHPEALASIAQTEAMIEQEIQKLPERQQTALNLCFYEGLSNQEAAEVMGLHIKALQSLLMRAKGTLKSRLGQERDVA